MILIRRVIKENKMHKKVQTCVYMLQLTLCLWINKTVLVRSSKSCLFKSPKNCAEFQSLNNDHQLKYCSGVALNEMDAQAVHLW